MPPLSLGGNVGGWSSADAELRDQVRQEHVDQVAEDPQPGAPQCVEAGRDGIARGPSQLRWLVRQVRREWGDGVVHGRDRDATRRRAEPVVEGSARGGRPDAVRRQRTARSPALRPRISKRLGITRARDTRSALSQLASASKACGSRQKSATLAMPIFDA